MLFRFFTAIWISYSLLFIGVNGKISKRPTVENLLTPSEAKYYFDSHENPNNNYDVVRFFKKQNATDHLELHFKAFGKREVVKLTPIDQEYFITENTPVWLARVINNEIKYIKAQQYTIRDVLSAYYSFEGRDCVLISDITKPKQKRDIKINGIVGDFVIRSLSPRTHKRLSRAKREINEDDYYNQYLDENFTATDYHLIQYDPKFRSPVTFYDGIIKNLDNTTDRIKRQLLENSDIKPEMPDTLYPRILVTTAFNTKFKGDRDPEVYDFLLYLMTFWTAVDLKFRVLERPKIRLHIAGIIIATELNATSYLLPNAVELGHGVNAYTMIEDMEWYFRNRSDGVDEIHRDAHSDIIIAMTRIHLCRGSEGCSKIQGIANITETCTRYNDETWNTNLFALVNDKGNDYRGVLAAAHEIGHVLGANHDGELGGSDCSPDDKNLMTPQLSSLYPERSANHWSWCSKRQIQETALNRTTSPCMNFIQRPEGNRICIPLPGHRMSLDEQCQARGANYACAVDSCDLRCKCTGNNVFTCSPWCTDWGFVWDGSPCGENYHCINGECVPKP